MSAPQLLTAPRGQGDPVILIPGWRAPEASMAPLRQLLRFKGYDARHWGLGVNRGDVAAYVERLLPDVRARAERSGQSVGLIGWSLGGIIARELARRLPGEVRCVITYGSPVVGGPSYTVAARRHTPEDRGRINAMIEERERSRPITVPIAAVFSRNDTIVSWPACIDRINPLVTHYEVDSTHFSMGVDPSVWRLVLEQLARYRPAAQPGAES